jgi:hypothetical protein
MRNVTHKGKGKRNVTLSIKSAFRTLPCVVSHRNFTTAPVLWNLNLWGKKRTEYICRFWVTNGKVFWRHASTQPHFNLCFYLTHFRLTSQPRHFRQTMADITPLSIVEGPTTLRAVWPVWSSKFKCNASENVDTEDNFRTHNTWCFRQSKYFLVSYSIQLTIILKHLFFRFLLPAVLIGKKIL